MDSEIVGVGVALFFLYSALFYVVLFWLEVSKRRIGRSVLIAAVLMCAELFAGFLTELLLDNQSGLHAFGYVLNTAITLLVFYGIAIRVIKAKAWQYIVIPIGVSFVGHMGVGIIVFVWSAFF